MSSPTKGTWPLAGSQFWAKHVKNCQQSLHSQARYCREHKLKLSTFRYWDRKLHHHKNRVPAGVAKSTERPGSNFIDVTHIITHPNTNLGRTISFLEIELGPDCKLKVPPQYDLEDLKKILVLVREVICSSI